MKETEIRIGNYFYHKSFGNYQFKKSHFGIRLNFSEPIPITEEWLLKFGFVKGGTIKGFALNGFLLFFNENMELFFRYRKNIKRPIKYIHQLQNLYFAITGYELEIKN